MLFHKRTKKIANVAIVVVTIFVILGMVALYIPVLFS
jgi:hypothetical protein